MPFYIQDPEYARITNCITIRPVQQRHFCVQTSKHKMDVIWIKCQNFDFTIILIPTQGLYCNQILAHNTMDRIRS